MSSVWDGIGMNSGATGRGPRSGAGHGLELVDEPARLGQRQVLGPADAELVAEQALQVGALGAGDGVDRLDLAGGRGLAGTGPRAVGPGPGVTIPGPRTAPRPGGAGGNDGAVRTRAGGGRRPVA